MRRYSFILSRKLLLLRYFWLTIDWVSMIGKAYFCRKIKKLVSKNRLLAMWMRWFHIYNLRYCSKGPFSKVIQIYEIFRFSFLSPIVQRKVTFRIHCRIILLPDWVFNILCFLYFWDVSSELVELLYECIQLILSHLCSH